MAPRRNAAPIIRLKSRTDSQSAKQLNREGIRRVERGELLKAESAFKRAIYADETFGPAHNNLGRIYFEKRKLKLAAMAFQQAMEFMPNRPEPYNNLGLAYEAAGRLDDAILQYETAHLMAMHQAEFLANLTRAKLRRGDRDDVLATELRELVFIDSRPKWTDWAEHHLAVSFRTDSPADAPNLERDAEEVGTPSPLLLSPQGELFPPAESTKAESTKKGENLLLQPGFLQ